MRRNMLDRITSDAARVVISCPAREINLQFRAQVTKHSFIDVFVKYRVNRRKISQHPYIQSNNSYEAAQYSFAACNCVAIEFCQAARGHQYVDWVSERKNMVRAVEIPAVKIK